MDCKIFYSWQSDLENKTNRGFIGNALEKAVKSIRNDDSIIVEPVIDRDTKNVPGSPDIVQTIFDKIEQAQIFVCDISIINKDVNYRLTPNPNVLIELGYAMKTLGEGKIIMVMNTAFGTPEKLPFDLRMRRVITYNMPVDNQEKSPERNNLAKSFERAIIPILQKVEEETKREVTWSRSKIKNYIEQLDSQIKELTPKLSEKSVENEDLLIKAIDLTEELVIEFAIVAEEIATTTESIEAAIYLYKSFGEITSYYSQPPTMDLHFGTDDEHCKSKEKPLLAKQSFNLDFYRFIVHELFVTYFSFIIRENRWELIEKILKEKVYYNTQKLGYIPFSRHIVLNDILKNISQPVELFENSSNYRHSEILNQRHTNGKIVEIVPMQQFIEADFFLFILSETKTKDDSDSYWHGWSLLYMEQTPKYLLEAKKVDFAKQLLLPLGLEKIEKLRHLISHAKTRLEQIWSNSSPASPYLPLKNFNPEDIGDI